MRTVGQILKEEREKKFYTLDEIEKETRIRKELLEALEADQYTKLPPPTFVQGFIKSYGKFLNLNSEKLLAVFRREFSDQKHPPRILESFSHPVDKKRFKLTPTRVLAGLIFTLIIIFFAYLWFEYRFLVSPPFLEVSQPPDQFNTSQADVMVLGKTDPEAKVNINDQEIAVDQSGKFAQQIKLSDNVNTITITAVSKTGKSSQVKRTVFKKS